MYFVGTAPKDTPADEVLDLLPESPSSAPNVLPKPNLLLASPHKQCKQFEGPRTSEKLAVDFSLLRMAPLDIVETPSEYIFRVDVPGFQGKDLRVRINPETLVISFKGERRQEKSANERLIWRERVHGSFTREFQLPSDADVERVTAACVDGILTISVKKLPPQPEHKRDKTIDVKVKSRL
ncbi:unnamed protein product [Closterium sp. Yama58-4]|nr:unnamed protein product [Closterium sp. Yama58-4]